MTEILKQQCEPPGFYIKEELEARQWGQVDLAYILGMTPQQLNKILSGRVGVTANLAVELGEAFDMPAEFFTNLQSQYEISLVNPSDPAIRKRANWQSTFPLREMIERSWIEDTDASLIDAQMLRFFEAEMVSDIPCIGENGKTVGHAAKKTNYDSTTPEQIAWLYRVRQIAKSIESPSYQRRKLEAAIYELEGLRSDPEDAPEAAEILLNAGVRLVTVEALPNSKIDGVCTWLEDSPVVAITNRFDRMDNFWFVLRHEVEHALQEHGKDIGATKIDDESTLMGEDVDEEERIANAAAAEFCVPQKSLRSLIARKGNYVSEKDIRAFAQRIGVHPAIVVGQYQHVTKKWNFLRKYLKHSTSGVRSYLLEKLRETNQIDGWGTPANVEL